MPTFKCIATLFKDLRTGPHDLLPPLHNIGNEIFATMPFPSLMTSRTTNILVEFNECNDNVNYRIHNWMRLLLRECPIDSKHVMDSLIKDGRKLSFVFNKSFEILANNTINIWGKLYNVDGNIIKDGSTLAFLGSNNTGGCSSDFIKRLTNTALSSSSEIVIQAAGIGGGSGWRITDENDPDGLGMPNGDPALASGLSSFGTQAIIMICGIFFVICAIFKIRDYCKSNKPTPKNDLDELYTPMTTIKSDKFVERNDYTYKYDENSDTWVNCTGLDSAYHA